MSGPSPLDFVVQILRRDAAATAAIRAALEQDRVDWPRVIGLASGHWVLPSLSAGLCRHGLRARVPAALAEALEAARFLNFERNQGLREALIELAAALNRLDLEPLLLKGANALLPDAYPGAEDRVIGDLDLWIPESRHAEAMATLEGLGYRAAHEAWQRMLPADRRRLHHGVPLLHRTRPVTVELHRRLVMHPRDDIPLATHLRTRRLELPAGVTVLAPDTLTRLRHNFLHAQIADRQARLRRLNLRQLLEFARLADTLGHGDAATLLDGLRPARRQACLEYWAQAEDWLGLPYPADLPRSPGEGRELWLTRRVAESPAWSLGFAVLDGATRLPRRLLGLGSRALRSPHDLLPIARSLWPGRAAGADGPPRD